MVPHTEDMKKPQVGKFNKMVPMKPPVKSRKTMGLKGSKKVC